MAATDRMQNYGMVMNYLWQQQTGCRNDGVVMNYLWQQQTRCRMMGW